MNNKKLCSPYTSSSEEDIPLSVVKDIENPVITIKDLSRKSVEICDICNKKFYNKYDLFIHNTTHIIIPLFRQDFHQCPECYCYCITKESLENHTYNKHLYIINPSDYDSGFLKSVLENTSGDLEDRDEVKIKHDKDLFILENLVKKEPVTVLVKEPFLSVNKTETKPDIGSFEQEKHILEDMVMKQAVTVLTKDCFLDKVKDGACNEMAVLIPLSKEKKTNNGHTKDVSGDKEKKMLKVEPLRSDVIDISDESCGIESVKGSEGGNSEAEGKKSRFRILFEDDDDDDVDDLLVEFKPKGLDENVSPTNNHKQNTIILGKYPVSVKYKSIHYDNLIEHSVHNCRKCFKSFENRYKLIIHETTHLKFKRRLPLLCKICDWYVASDIWTLRYHQQRKHPNDDIAKIKPTSYKICNKCNLRYLSLTKHERNYHSNYMIPVEQDELYHSTATDKTVHCRNLDNGIDRTESWGSKTVNVCELCYAFFKNRLNIRYKLLNDTNKMGDRMQCERCNKMFFELKHVKIEVKKREKKELNMFERKSTVSNKDRLKIVHQRLKKLKLLNKL